MPAINLVTSDENVELYFIPLNRIQSYISGYVEGNWAFSGTGGTRTSS